MERSVDSYLFDVRNMVWFAGIERKLSPASKKIEYTPTWTRTKDLAVALQFRILQMPSATLPGESELYVQIGANSGDAINRGRVLTLVPNADNPSVSHLEFAVLDAQASIEYYRSAQRHPQFWKVGSLGNDFLSLKPLPFATSYPTQNDATVKAPSLSPALATIEWPLFFSLSSFLASDNTTATATQNDAYCLVQESNVSSSLPAAQEQKEKRAMLTNVTFLAASNVDVNLCGTFMLVPTDKSMDGLVKTILARQ